MKKISILLILISTLAIGITLSCEPDDICPGSTATTPNLIIEAYDVTKPENKLAITNLAIGGVGNDFLLTNGIVSAQKITLPLKTDADTTQYILIKNATINNNGTPNDSTDDFIQGNSDTITISYTRENVYVSRACGYKTIFKNVTFIIESDNDNWIKSRQPLIENLSIEDETQTHFNIFH